MADGSSNVFSLQHRWRLHLRRGTRLFEEGRFQEAKKAFEQVLEESSEEPQAQLFLAKEFIRQEAYDDAEHILRIYLQRHPDAAEAATLLAKILGLYRGQKGEALEMLQHALGNGAEPYRVKVALGEIHVENKAYDDARKVFSEVLSSSNDTVLNEEARYGLARSYNQEGIELSEHGQFEQAIFAFKRAIDLDPAWSGTYVNLGVAFSRLGKHAKAIEAFRRAIGCDPNNPVALFNLAMAEHQCGRLADAVDTLEDLLLLAPDFPDVRRSLANVLAEMMEFDRAIALLLEELEVDPERVNIWTSLGLAYICAGHPQRGEECLLHALELDPHYLNAMFNLANLYLTQKRFSEVENVLERAYAVDVQLAKEFFQADSRFQHYIR